MTVLSTDECTNRPQAEQDEADTRAFDSENVPSDLNVRVNFENEDSNPPTACPNLFHGSRRNRNMGEERHSVTSSTPHSRFSPRMLKILVWAGGLTNRNL